VAHHLGQRGDARFGSSGESVFPTPRSGSARRPIRPMRWLWWASPAAAEAHGSAPDAGRPEDYIHMVLYASSGERGGGALEEKLKRA
jgi:hypothetical protein